MRLLSASALWWLLLSALIILFYLLKLRRKRRVVPSVFLWQRALEEVEANTPFKRLRRSLLLLLQLLILAALAFALARPLVTTRALATGSTIIVIDSTASMSSRDEGGGSRLDRAKQLARDLVASLGGADRASIIESSSRVTVRSPLTSDHAALASAIDRIRETDSAGALTDALRLAGQVAKAEPESSVVVVSDGGGAPTPSGPGAPPAAVSPTPLRFVRVGNRADNVGIVALNTRPVQGNVRQEMFASVANFADHDRSIPVELRIDQRLVDVRTLNVAAHDRAALVFDSLPQAGGLAELRLKVDDDLAADDTAYALLPDARRLRVGVASDNPFLLQALAVNPDLDVRKVASSAAPPAAEFDCLVGEGALGPGFIEADRSVLAINPPDVEGLWKVVSEREAPAITTLDRSHPVNSYLTFADIHIERAPRRDVAPWLKPIVGEGGDALAWAGDDGRRRVVMVGFDLARSDLPLKVEFPLMLANSLSWLAGRDANATDRAVRAGQPVTIRGLASDASITLPTGDSVEVAAREGSAVFADTWRAGIYAVKDAPAFAASLLSESESDTTPRESISTRAGEVSGRAETLYSEREAWRWVALAALTILAVEWWVYHRRITG